MSLSYDLVIVGMGSGGMVGAEFAAKLGIKVAVVERDRVGGDCLWTGCVPSKALLASAKAAHTMRHADGYGLASVDPDRHRAGVGAHPRDPEQIAATDDDPERFEAGVDVLRRRPPDRPEHRGSTGAGETRHATSCCDGQPAGGAADRGARRGGLPHERERLRARPGAGERRDDRRRADRDRAGAGVHPARHPGDGAAEGPGSSRATSPSWSRALPDRLRDEGVDLLLDVETERSRCEDGRKPRAPAGAVARSADLVAAGRVPNVEGLGLEEVGVKVGPRGVGSTASCAQSEVDLCRGRRRRPLPVHALGRLRGCARRAQHVLPGQEQGSDLVPWCTFTDPELAHAGLTEAEARASTGDDVEVWPQDLAHSDRARADGAADGEIRIVTAKGRIVGAHALAPSAGELIHELALAIAEGKKLTELASLIHVYPTIAMGIGQLAGEAAYEGRASSACSCARRRRPAPSAAPPAAAPRRGAGSRPGRARSAARTRARASGLGVGHGVEAGLEPLLGRADARVVASSPRCSASQAGLRPRRP